jgi:hypothetical protein
MLTISVWYAAIIAAIHRTFNAYNAANEGDIHRIGGAKMMGENTHFAAHIVF